MSSKNPTEQNRTTNLGQDRNTTTTGTTGQHTAGSATQRAREDVNETVNRGEQIYEQAKQSASKAYDKTAEALSGTYDQAMSYGKEHPGQLTLIAFGAGIGIGLLMASSFTSRSRSSRIVEPAINALSQIALELFGR